MKPHSSLLILSIAALLPCASFAVDFAPAKLSYRSAVFIISSGAYPFGNIGGYRTFFSPSTYNAVGLSSNILGTQAGNYTWTKTGPNTGTMTGTTNGLLGTFPSTFVFSSPSTATYYGTSTYYGGYESGTMVMESIGAASAGLVNFSVRAQIPNGSQAIPGLLIDSPTRCLVRVAGPALAAYGVSGTLPNPRFTVYSGQTPIASNDDWSSTGANQTACQTAVTATGAFPFAPGSNDAALVLDLNAGAYTVVVTGATGTSGEVLLEVYRVPQ